MSEAPAIVIRVHGAPSEALLALELFVGMAALLKNVTRKFSPPSLGSGLRLVLPAAVG
jgi:hypothetical protein